MGWLTYTQPVSGFTRRYSGCSPDMEYMMAALVPKSSSWAATRKKLVPIIVSSRRKSDTAEKGAWCIFTAVRMWETCRTEYCTRHNVIAAVRTVRQKSVSLCSLKQHLGTVQGGKVPARINRQAASHLKSSWNHAVRGLQRTTVMMIMMSFFYGHYIIIG